MKILLTLIILSLSQVFAQGVIKSSDYNNKIFQIGSIQKSILSESRFIEIHGNCWRKLNGAPITGTSLSEKIPTLPDASSRFLRNSGSPSAPAVGQTQEDSLGPHRHWISNGPYDDGNGSGSNANNQRSGLVADANSYSPDDPMYQYGRNILPAGGTETRPKNITVNMFVKVNNECN